MRFDLGTDLAFPPDFLWGAATAAYQIEGAASSEGKGPSIWDVFTHTPGMIAGGDTGDVACDHYNRWPEDVALMQLIGLKAYRFSISWPRVLPEGKGRINQRGLDFYDELVDALLGAGIEPVATLYHWDLPQALQEEGGWAKRQTASYMADFASVVGGRLGDRIEKWITVNEPAVIAFDGHLYGTMAPGIKDERTAYQVGHNLLLSHGLAMQALRAARRGCSVGITLNLIPMYPYGDSEQDERSARLKDGLQNRWFLDPLFKGCYPEDALEVLGSSAPAVEEGDMATISAPMDFLGFNYYTRWLVRYTASAPDHGIEQVLPEGAEYTAMGWEVYPEGLRALLERLHRDYPIGAYYVTENGAAYPDVLEPDGQVHDSKRIEYLQSHVRACAEAMQTGVPLKGYFVWSLMDNLEWAQGFSKRFGLLYVDYATERRILKDSARWYQSWVGAQSG